MRISIHLTNTYGWFRVRSELPRPCETVSSSRKIKNMSRHASWWSTTMAPVEPVLAGFFGLWAVSLASLCCYSIVVSEQQWRRGFGLGNLASSLALVTLGVDPAGSFGLFPWAAVIIIRSTSVALLTVLALCALQRAAGNAVAARHAATGGLNGAASAAVRPLSDDVCFAGAVPTRGAAVLVLIVHTASIAFTVTTSRRELLLAEAGLTALVVAVFGYFALRLIGLFLSELKAVARAQRRVSPAGDKLRQVRAEHRLLRCRASAVRAILAILLGLVFLTEACAAIMHGQNLSRRVSECGPPTASSGDCAGIPGDPRNATSSVLPWLRLLGLLGIATAVTAFGWPLPRSHGAASPNPNSPLDSRGRNGGVNKRSRARNTRPRTKGGGFASFSPETPSSQAGPGDVKLRVFGGPVVGGPQSPRILALRRQDTASELAARASAYGSRSTENPFGYASVTTGTGGGSAAADAKTMRDEHFPDADRGGIEALDQRQTGAVEGPSVIQSERVRAGLMGSVGNDTARPSSSAIESATRKSDSHSDIATTRLIASNEAGVVARADVGTEYQTHQAHQTRHPIRRPQSAAATTAVYTPNPSVPSIPSISNATLPSVEAMRPGPPPHARCSGAAARVPLGAMLTSSSGRRLLSLDERFGQDSNPQLALASQPQRTRPSRMGHNISTTTIRTGFTGSRPIDSTRDSAESSPVAVGSPAIVGSPHSIGGRTASPVGGGLSRVKTIDMPPQRK